MSENPTPMPKPGLPEARRALRMVSMSMPHLAGLASAVRLELDQRVAAMAVFASGRILINPHFLASLKPEEAMFVLAHELMHLALRTHDRQGDADPLLVNYAHDYIINDMLASDLQQPIPAEGLCMVGARDRSLENLVAELRNQPRDLPPSGWRMAVRPAVAPPASFPKLPRSGLGEQIREAMQRAGLPIPTESAEAPPPAPAPEPEPIPIPGDVFGADLERDWFPDVQPEQIARQTEKITKAAAQADSIAAVIEKMKQLPIPQAGDFYHASGAFVTALRGIYAPPWQVALQRWMDTVAPGPRSFARPSRRSADRTDVVLPGRMREGWTLHIVLDTSGSMTGMIPACLGAIADFGASAGIEQVHLLQCDTSVTQDDFVPIEELDYYHISGYGGSDMSPAMNRLAEDPEVEAAIVLTDGAIFYPPESPPYSVLWVLPESLAASFTPSYGAVLGMRHT